MADNQTPPKAEKPRFKKKGPIRTEAVVPFAIVVGLIVLYFVLFFDHNLKSAMEWGATYANGAEVDIDRVKTSFLHASLEVNGIEVTNPLEPEKNRVQIGRVHFQALWDALLRAKFVIDDSSITGIEVNTQRRRPGRVLPPPPPEGPSLFAKMKSQLVKSTLGDVGDLLEGFDPSKNLKDLGNLKSAEYIQKLKGDLDHKQKDWQSTLAKIPSDKDFSDLQAKLNSISTSVSNPGEAIARANQVKGLIGEVQGKVNAVTSVSSQLTGDINSFSGAVGGIDQAVAADRQELESKLKLPKLDAKSLAEQLFGGLVSQKVGSFEKYVTMAKQYMPTKSSKKDAPKPVKPPRGRGHTYEFPITTGYPLFWLKKAEISSKGEFSAFAGDVTGKILDVSTNQRLVGRPMVADLQGDFPKQNVRQVAARLTFDHRAEEAIESIEASVGAFPVPAETFTESEGFKFGIGKALGKSKIAASLKGSTFDIASDNEFSSVDYQIGAKSKLLESTVKSIVAEMPTFNVQAKVGGTWDHFDVGIQSNLATALEKGFARQLQAKLAEARQKLNALIDEKIMGPKKELLGKFDATKAQLTSQIDSRKKQADQLMASANGKLGELTQKASPQNNAVEGLKKKLPFGH